MTYQVGDILETHNGEFYKLMEIDGVVLHVITTKGKKRVLLDYDIKYFYPNRQEVIGNEL